MTDSKANPPVDGVPCRRFNLWDGMVLIAAIAVGLALGKRAFLESYPEILLPPRLFWFFAIFSVHNAACLCIEVLSAAILLLRLRQPRPPLYRAMRQPGAIACAIPLLVILWLGGTVIILGLGFSSAYWAQILSLLNGMLVAGVWLAVWIKGYWRQEKGWIDGAGRILGICWLLLPLVLWGTFYF